MRWPWLVGLLAACGSGDIRVAGSDDGPYEGRRAWAELADIEANEAIEVQRTKVEDGAFEFLFVEPPDGALAVSVQVEAVEGTGCGPAILVELDGVQVGAVEVHTDDFTDYLCLGAPSPAPATTDE